MPSWGSAQNDTKRAGRIISSALWICALAGCAISVALLLTGKMSLAATGELRPKCAVRQGRPGPQCHAGDA